MQTVTVWIHTVSVWIHTKTFRKERLREVHDEAWAMEFQKDPEAV